MKTDQEKAGGKKRRAKKISLTTATTVVVFLVALVVYIITLAPIVTVEDSGEFIIGAYTLSVIHPPGYPLYCLLGKLFTLLPISSIAWRVNFMSAFFGALSVATLFLFVQQVTKHKQKILIGIVTSLSLAFSATLWSQSVVAEVNTLNLFVLLLGLLLIAMWGKKKDNIWLYLFVFIYGLSLTNHHIMLGMAPIYALYILFLDWRVIKKAKQMLLMIVLFIVPLSLYAYLPLRARANPIINWGSTDNWEGFVYHILRKEYGGSGLEHIFNASAWVNKTTHIIEYFTVRLPEQFSVWLLVLALVGLVYMWQKQKKVTIVLLAMFLMFSIGYSVLVVYLPINDYERQLIHIFYLPSYITVAYAIGWSVVGFVDLMERYVKKGLPWDKVAYLLLAVPVIICIMNYSNSNHHNDYYTYDYAKNILGAVEQDAVLLVQSDSLLRNFWYLQTIEDYRADVTTINYYSFYTNYWWDELAAKYEAERPLAVLSDTAEGQSDGERFTSYIDWFHAQGLPLYVENGSAIITSPHSYNTAYVQGYSYAMDNPTYDEIAAATINAYEQGEQWPVHNNLNVNLYKQNPFLGDLVLQEEFSLYSVALAYVYQGRYEEAEALLISMLENRPSLNENWEEYLEAGLISLQSIIREPESVDALFQYGWQRVWGLNNQHAMAGLAVLNKALEINSEHAESYLARSLAYYQLADFDQAYEDIKKGMEFEPLVKNDFLMFFQQAPSISSFEQQQQAQELVSKVQAL